MAKSAISQYAYYVHYHAQNFTKSNKMQSTALSQYARDKARNVANQFRSKVNDYQKQNYVELVSALMKRRTVNGLTTDRLTAAELSQIQDTIIDSLSHGFDKSIDKIDWERGIVGGVRHTGSSYYGARRYLTNDQIDRLSKQATDIRTAIVQANNSIRQGLIDPTKLDQLKALLEKQESELQALKQNFTQDAKEYKFFGHSAIRIDAGANMSERIDNINNLARELGFQQVILTGTQGELFEKVLYAAGNMANGIAVNTILGTFIDPKFIATGMLTGDQKNAIEWKINGIPAGTWAQTAMAQKSIGRINRTNIRYDISNQKSQLKTDVIVEFPSMGQDIGVTANISAKSGNIFGKHPIGLVSGTNLWYLIQDLDFKFLRQYLNVIAEHAYFYDFSRKKLNNFATKEAAAIETIKSYRQDALLATQILGIWKAISGYNFGRYGSAAQLLVLNDTIGKKVYLLEIADIINYICNGQNLTNGTLQRYFTFEGMDYNSLWLDNRWENSLHNRMAKLLTSAHAKKISVAMQGNLINNIKHIIA